MSVYADRFWMKNWDEGMTDLDPKEFETTYVDMIRRAFEESPNKTALGYLGVRYRLRLSEYHSLPFLQLGESFLEWG